MMAKRLLPLLCLPLLCGSAFGESNPAATGHAVSNTQADGKEEQAALTRTTKHTSFSELVLRAVAMMPEGGEYSVDKRAAAALRRAASLQGDALVLHPDKAKPSFCSGATYLVFLKALQLSAESSPVAVDLPAAALVPKGQSDGEGVWGRWNANGPGTARLLHESGIGVNFTALDQAVPGDFLKIFWNESIGKNESGHSVVFLGLETLPTGERGISFWSSNKGQGYGKKVVPLSKIKRALFSRVVHVEKVAALAGLPARDAYLSQMLTRKSTGKELCAMVGLPADSFKPLEIPNPDQRIQEPVESISKHEQNHEQQP